MSVKIRLQRHGRKKAPFYHIVVANSTSPRDGKFIEQLGYYNPTTIPAKINIDIDKAVQWLQNGAQPTTTANAILRYKGVLYKKHLLRGVTKGALTQEAADAKFEEWLKAHEGAVMDHEKRIADNKSKLKSDELARIQAKREEKATKKAAEEAEKIAIAEQEAAAKIEEPTQEINEIEEAVSNDTSTDTPVQE